MHVHERAHGHFALSEVSPGRLVSSLWVWELSIPSASTVSNPPPTPAPLQWISSSSPPSPSPPPAPPLGANNSRVAGGIRQHGVLAVVQKAVAPAAVADEEECGQEDQGTDGAGLPLQQEAEQVEAHEHGVVEPQSRVQGLRDKQHWKEPLETIHYLWEEWKFLIG